MVKSLGECQSKGETNEMSDQLYNRSKNLKKE